MKIVVIDGQGGGIGRQIVERLKVAVTGVQLIALGTNVLATSAMLKAGADAGATGENAIVYHCARADLIVGPLGILIANSLMGEFSERMACAVAKSDAHKVLIPISKCHAEVVGVMEKPVAQYLDDMVAAVRHFCERGANLDG